MAKEKRAKKDNRTPEEKQLAERLENLKKEIGDKTPSEAQKQLAKTLKAKLGAVRFVRIANKRVPVVLAKIEGIGALGGASYVSTEAQRKAIAEAMEKAVKDAVQNLSGKVESVSGFQLPST